MLFIVVKFTVRQADVAHWLDRVDDFTQATRGEAGNLWFEWSRSVERDDEFVLVEAFADGEAGSAHVSSDHFRAAMESMPAMLVRTPQILSTELPETGWSRMGELTVLETED